MVYNNQFKKYTEIYQNINNNIFGVLKPKLPIFIGTKTIFKGDLQIFNVPLYRCTLFE